MKFGILTLALFAICSAFAGCGAGAKDRKFEYEDEGFSITLTGDFTESSYINFKHVYISNNCAVYVTRETFETLDTVYEDSENMTKEQYANIVIQNNDVLATVSHDEEYDFVCFNYTKKVNGDWFYYFAVIDKGPDAFWMCQFACMNDAKEKLIQKMKKWASTISVNTNEDKILVDD